ncbi:MAG: ribonuclease P protein component [Malacoplasma sp.]|nr:ribonuclease P protein component [Malacoplasma sp.]
MKNSNVLKSKKDFNNLFENKTVYYSSFFIIYVSKNKLSNFRYEIAPNKKNFKLAVERNKIKRQIRSIVCELKDEIYGIDFLIIPKNNYFDANFFDKKKDLLNLIAKIYLKLNQKNERRK